MAVSGQAPAPAAELTAPRDRGVVRAAVTAMRPAEWTKNVLVLAPLVFSGRFDVTSTGRAGLAFLALCAISSAGYLVNDVRDAECDRRHPRKRLRPVASGALPAAAALALAAGLAVAALALGAVVSPGVAALVAGYGALTVAYSLVLKRLVIIDVMTIAGCFLLRVVVGAVAIEASASRWLIVCTAMLALFLGFTKRRQEAAAELEDRLAVRPVLEHYSLPFLDQMVPMVTAGTIISYAIYATESPLVGDRMLVTAPMVLYGIFRYLYLIYQCGDTRDAATLVTRDPGLIGAAVAWVAAALLVLYV